MPKNNGHDACAASPADADQELPSAMFPMYTGNAHALASRFTRFTDEDSLMMTSLAQAALDNLLAMAKIAAEQSYSPYSGFKVGAALRLSNGKVVTGTNVENVSYGLTICAERAALVRAVSEFGPEIRIEAVAVANLNDAASPPCGACRQMLAEFAEHDALVAFPAADGTRMMPFEQVLPFGFDMKLKRASNGK
jgi:cytidine deaminase